MAVRSPLDKAAGRNKFKRAFVLGAAAKGCSRAMCRGTLPHDLFETVYG